MKTLRGCIRGFFSHLYNYSPARPVGQAIHPIVQVTRANIGSQRIIVFNQVPLEKGKNVQPPKIRLEAIHPPWIFCSECLKGEKWFVWEIFKEFCEKFKVVWRKNIVPIWPGNPKMPNHLEKDCCIAIILVKNEHTYHSYSGFTSTKNDIDMTGKWSNK
ncbi:hypothetical protein [Desulfatibacillum aliphaticivorans]|uniref:hypothetical protein n=1 Tax=Desulfatibacillum aliphaticivorans TaxID=218208 RepID=UPI0010A3F648|nr:hypothetical protein [Desulfatibacillum aliphaticivorans]